MTSPDLQALAQQLWTAREQRKPIPPLTETHPEITLEQAYAISKSNHARRVSAPGVRPIGKKIGLTSKAVQKQLGVDQPDFGYLTSDMLVENGAQVTTPLIQPKAEAEVAFVLCRDLNATSGPITPEQVIAATDCVRACIEIIDSRVENWKIRIQDTVADNASSALLVLGPEKRSLKDVDLRLAGMWLKKNDEIESTGAGAACLDHPVLAVTWLANTMVRFGDPLKAGDLVLAGAFGPVIPVAPGDRCEAEISGLGRVSCRF